MGYPKQLQTSRQPASRARNPPFLPSVGRNRGSRAFPGERGRRSPSSTFKKPAQRVAIQLRERRIPSRAAFPRAQPAIPAIGWQKSRVARVSTGARTAPSGKHLQNASSEGCHPASRAEDPLLRRFSARATRHPCHRLAEIEGCARFPGGRGRRRASGICKTPVQRVVIQLYMRRLLPAPHYPSAQPAIPAMGWQESRVVRVSTGARTAPSGKHLQNASSEGCHPAL